MLLGVIAGAVASAPTTGDALWAYVTSLVSFDGSASTFTDKKSGLKWQIVDPAIRVDGRFGKALDTSARGYATTVDATVDQLNAFNFGSGPFCIELFTCLVGNGNDAYPVFLDFQDANYNGWCLYGDKTTKLFRFYEKFSRVSDLPTPQNVMFYDTPGHVAITRDENKVLRIFVGGVLVVEEAGHDQVHTRFANQLWISRQFANNGSVAAGLFEQIRVTKGVPRYVAAFTPPTKAFPTNAAVTAPVIVPAVKQVSAPFRPATAATTGTSSLPGIIASSYVMFAVMTYQSAITSVTGTLNGTYPKIFEAVDNNDNRITVYGKVSIAGDEVLTVTPTSPNDAYMSGFSAELTGVSGVIASKIVYNTLTVASDSDIPLNSLVVNFVLSELGGSSNFGLPAGFTLLDRENNGDSYTAEQSAYRVTTATGVVTATATASASLDNYDAYLLVFK